MGADKLNPITVKSPWTDAHQGTEFAFTLPLKVDLGSLSASSGSTPDDSVTPPSATPASEPHDVAVDIVSSLPSLEASNLDSAIEASTIANRSSIRSSNPKDNSKDDAPRVVLDIKFVDRMRVLIADDMKMNAVLLKRSLARVNPQWESDLVHTGEEALELCTKNHYARPHSKLPHCASPRACSL